MKNRIILYKVCSDIERLAHTVVSRCFQVFDLWQLDRTLEVSAHVVGGHGITSGAKSSPGTRDTNHHYNTFNRFTLIVYIQSQYQNIIWRQSKFVSRHSAKCSSLFRFLERRTCTCPICCFLRFQIRSLLQFFSGEVNLNKS